MNDPQYPGTWTYAQVCAAEKRDHEAHADAIEYLIAAAMMLEREEGAAAGLDASTSAWQRFKSAEAEARDAIWVSAAVAVPPVLGKIVVHGRLHEYQPAAAAFDLPDGEHAICATPQAPAEPKQAPAEVARDAITKSKRILALVDKCIDNHTTANRSELRAALMDEFSALAPKPQERLAMAATLDALACIADDVLALIGFIEEGEQLGDPYLPRLRAIETALRAAALAVPARPPEIRETPIAEEPLLDCDNPTYQRGYNDGQAYAIANPLPESSLADAGQLRLIAAAPKLLEALAKLVCEHGNPDYRLGGAWVKCSRDGRPLPAGTILYTTPKAPAEPQAHADLREALRAALVLLCDIEVMTEFSAGRLKDRWDQRNAIVDSLRALAARAVPAGQQEQAPNAEAGGGPCLPHGLPFDAFGEPRVRYVRVSLDGNHCVMHPSEGDTYLKDARDGGDESPYVIADVYLSEREFEDLPEHEGF